MFWKDRIGRKEGGKKERKKKGSRKKRRKENRTMNELMEVGLREGKVFLTTGSILLFLFYLFIFLIGGQLLYNILSHQKNMIH